jgi:hypothetical protein
VVLRDTVGLGSTAFAESALVAPFAWAYDQLFGNSWIPDIVNGFSEWIPQIPGIIASALAGVGEALVAPFRDAATNLLGILARLPGQILGFIVGIPGMISGALSRVTSVLPQPFQDGISAVRSRLSGFPGMVSNFVSGIPGVVSSALSGLAGAFSRPFATAYGAVSGWVSAIRTLISGIGASISGAASRVSSLASRARGLTPFASGGVVYGPTRALIGEAGREAVIPLDRPLNMVDPISAVAGRYRPGQGHPSHGVRWDRGWRTDHDRAGGYRGPEQPRPRADRAAGHGQDGRAVPLRKDYLWHLTGSCASVGPRYSTLSAPPPTSRR